MTTDWTSAVYSQERKVVKITNFNASTVMVRLSVSALNISADYYVPTSRVLDIDVTDIVRLAQSGTFYLSGYNSSGVIVSSDVATCSWSTAGLVTPYKDIKPQSELLEKWREIADTVGGDVAVTVAPPSRILEQLADFALIIEMHGLADIWVHPLLTTTSLFNAATSQITIPQNLNAWQVENEPEQLSYGEYGVTERDGCRNYCGVRWTSRYGVRKQFVWEYRDLRVKVSETVDIETINGAYDERKGYVQGLTLYLDELNQYDYWYYSDIVTSSSVEVLIAGTWYTVQVENKEVTVPNFDTGEPNKLEVQINVRKYDAI